jgi:hypothetical protein
MKRFLIFSVLFPPLALAVFTAPDSFKNLLDWIGMAYAAAMIPAWLMAGVDWMLSAKPTYLRIAGTTVAAALMTGSIASFLWGGFGKLFPALMAMLVGAIPAAACSWLSDTSMRGKMFERGRAGAGANPASGRPPSGRA